MYLSEIQQQFKEFIEKRGWLTFNKTQVFTHLIEELGEIGSHLLYQEKYKIKGIGHEGTDSSLEREFAQVFNLLMQLAIMENIDLENAWKKEFEIMKKRFPEDKWREALGINNSGSNP